MFILDGMNYLGELVIKNTWNGEENGGDQESLAKVGYNAALHLCLETCVLLKDMPRALIGEYSKRQYGKYPNGSIRMGRSRPEPMTELLMSFSDLDWF